MNSKNACVKTDECFDASGVYSEGLPSVSVCKGVYDFERSKDLAFESADESSGVVDGRTC